MKIVMLGDSLTCMNRVLVQRGEHYDVYLKGEGYVTMVEGLLIKKYPTLGIDIVNSGIGGDRVVDLYARIKKDAWNHNPDVLSIQVGINDVLAEINSRNGVESDRFDKIYRMMIDDTLERLPNVKLILITPIVLDNPRFEGDAYAVRRQGAEINAKIIKQIGADYKIPVVDVQPTLDDLANVMPPKDILGDGIHPSPIGARVIAEAWLKAYEEAING